MAKETTFQTRQQIERFLHQYPEFPWRRHRI
jgi:hypothetical protein